MGHIEFSWQTARGLNIYAQSWIPEGEIRGVVALVHGLGEHSGRYAHVAAALNQAGYALTGFDLPGHGKSGGTRGHTSFEETLFEIDHLLEDAGRRFPNRPRFLYGHSMGGSLTLYYLLRRKPDLCGAVVTSPGLGVGQPVPSMKIFLAKVMARLFPAFTMENGLDLNNLSRDEAVVTTYRQDPLVHPRISARLGLDLLTLGAWIQANAVELETPLLLIQGGGDHIVSPQATEAFAQAAPASKITYKVWENFYHELHNEPEKDQVFQFMLDWLDKHTG